MSAGLEIALPDGRTIRETHVLTQIPGDRGLLINGDSVTRSVTSTPAQRPTMTQERKDKEEGGKKDEAKKCRRAAAGGAV
ncbi:hypothetical protein [Amycolatopsis sp. EV170708-02-1]|uniref:hypothetical protein n=1 Tax=Amycolatopsis sp. EV170708-02-1 TaxID=2919322 RepID=UPI001F0BF9D6|nr:hypothetical protein [Amycolatopsis sp. EV170708-02-1]UMP00084.1 hypothetical protein MJQ72_26670 [Amycolatopsis sp. EV170708-02-1]